MASDVTLRLKMFFYRQSLVMGVASGPSLNTSRCRHLGFFSRLSKVWIKCNY